MVGLLGQQIGEPTVSDVRVSPPLAPASGLTRQPTPPATPQRRAGPQPPSPQCQYDLGQVVTANGQYLAFPWRICARVLVDQLTFKVWVPQREPEPEWNDSVHARTTEEPTAYITAGNTGWYVGHIPAGGSTRYNALATWTWPEPDDPSGLATSHPSANVERNSE